MKNFKSLRPGEQVPNGTLVKIANEQFWLESYSSKYAQYVGTVGEVQACNSYSCNVWWPALNKYHTWSTDFLTLYSETREVNK